MIIGLVGYKGSGKTTAANIIKKHLEDVVHINFKDALIDEIKDKFPDLLDEILINHTDCTTVDDLFQYKPQLVRTLMQNYGTDVRRKEDAMYWVDRWTQSYWDAPATSNVLVDDIRFLNEASRVKGQAGILIRLERTDLESTDTHLTETEQQQIECNYTITVGKGELDKLESELIKIIDGIRNN